MFEGVTGNAESGARIFWASGCASCHAAPKSEDQDRKILAGGHAFPSDFGTFFAPNISADSEQGIGDWTVAELATALRNGVSPAGQHYYPAFPYTTYQNMTDTDVADLFAYLKTLPADATPNIPHDVSFPFSIRRGLGLWKLMFTPARISTDDNDLTDQQVKGRYLVEALGHCTECHTPRNALGGLEASKWLAGGPNPDGPGRIPNITPHADGIGSWAPVDVVTYLNSGLTPEYDSAGGAMVDVIRNLSQLPREDLEAMAAYLASVEPIHSDP